MGLQLVASGGYIEASEMSEVGVRELRNNLSRWLHRVERGDELLVTDRGRPVARVVRAGSRDALEELIEAGHVALPRFPKGTDSRRRLVHASGSVADLVVEQRG